MAATMPITLVTHNWCGRDSESREAVIDHTPLPPTLFNNESNPRLGSKCWGVSDYPEDLAKGHSAAPDAKKEILGNSS
jgi:hypothetical protein